VFLGFQCKLRVYTKHTWLLFILSCELDTWIFGHARVCFERWSFTIEYQLLISAWLPLWIFLFSARCAMQLRHKKCLSVIGDHKWPLADGIASPHMDSVAPVKKAKMRHKNAVNVQLPLGQYQCEVCIYTVFRKKHPLTFLIITPVFLGRFL